VYNFLFIGDLSTARIRDQHHSLIIYAFIHITTFPSAAAAAEND